MPGRFYFSLVVWLLLSACSNDNPIDSVLNSNRPAIRTVLDNLETHELQILYSQIVRGEDDSIQFIDHSYGVDNSKYFYPASTVKLPVALLALEKLQKLDTIDRYSRYTVGESTSGSSFTNDLIKLFVVSDDAAYNRLFEFLGKDEINQRLQSKGVNARIAHRLSIPDSDVLPTQTVRFSQASGATLEIGPISNNAIEILPLENLVKGVAYMDSGQLVQQPFDFSEKNYLPLLSLHETMKRLLFPENFSAEERFHLSEEHREFVLRAMSTLPREAGFDETEFPDGEYKYLVFGDSEERIPEHIEIYNKIGFAYGYLTDTAYIVDQASGKEVLITATIHVNANQTFNDDQYEYEEVGLPFLAELGRQLLLN
ncbi:MAG: class A beta-lactamase-related serine hydrolase [Pseudomonadales bacterium]|nr:class A beta-lactamase-related serine hydrolase [Pseudomonadales bacterium]